MKRRRTKRASLRRSRCLAEVLNDVARYGQAGLGMAGTGPVRQGTARHGAAGHGEAGQGAVWFGLAWYGLGPGPKGPGDQPLRRWAMSVYACDTWIGAWPDDVRCGHEPDQHAPGDLLPGACLVPGCGCTAYYTVTWNEE